MLHSRLVTIRWRLQFTPIYALLSEHGGNSIHLAPLPTPKVLEPERSLQGHGDYALGDDPMDLSSNDESPFSASAQQSSQSSVTAGSETRVLLAVSIQQDAAHDVSQWVTWLTTQAPWDVTKVEVKVEGAYESHSTLVLVSIPIYAWDGLPEKDAYRFIAFVKSSNLQQPGKSSQLASRALSASNLSKEHELFPLVSVSRYGSTKSLELSAEEAKVALQKYYQNIMRHVKDETAVVKADTEWNVDSGGAMIANLADSYSNAEVGKKSYDALQTDATPSGDLDKLSAPRSSSIGDIPSTDSNAIQPKPKSNNPTDSWISKSGPWQYPRSSTFATMNHPTSPKGRRSADPWHAQDDEQLIQARKRGMSWGPIAQEFFPSKSANACRKRHERLMDKISTNEDWAPTKLEEMARLYLDLREQMWRLVARRLGKNWKTVEAKVCSSKLQGIEG